MTHGSASLNSRTPGTDVVVPCIDVARGRAAEPSGAPGLVDPYDVVGIARTYARDGATKLFLDVLDSWQDVGYLPDLLRALEETGLAPLVSVQHGVLPSLAACETLLAAGADMVSVSTGMVEEPELVASATRKLGGHRFLGVLNCAADGAGTWRVLIHGGATRTHLEATSLARRYGELGAGAVLANSVDREGTAAGYDLDLTRAVARASGQPVIASGGAGTADHLSTALDAGGASYVLVNKLVHTGRTSIARLCEELEGHVSPEGDGSCGR